MVDAEQRPAVPGESERVTRSRTVSVLSLGAKLSIVAGLLLLVVAAFYYYVPIQFDTASGPFKCGSAAQPVNDTFGKNTCGYRPTINRYRALALGASAVIVVVGGVVCFGAARRPEDAGQE